TYNSRSGNEFQKIATLKSLPLCLWFGRFSWPALVHEGRKEIDRDWKKRGRVMLAGNLAHGLEKAQLECNRLLAHHRGGLHHFCRGLKFAFGIHHLGATLALGFGLLGHGTLHRVGQDHVLDLHRRNFHAPRLGLFVDDILQCLVDRLALRKQIIERGLAEHAAQRGLGDERGGFEKILHFDDRGLRIDHAEINNRIDRYRHVVTRHHLLSLDANGHNAQIHAHHAIDDRDQKNQSRPFRAEYFSETTNHASFVFAQDT